MGVFLFILLNATLFARPAELVPALEGWPIYEGLILSCFLFAAPALLARMAEAGRSDRPISACVYGLLVAVVLSRLANGDPPGAFEGGFDFFKVVIYYL